MLSYVRKTMGDDSASAPTTSVPGSGAPPYAALDDATRGVVFSKVQAWLTANSPAPATNPLPVGYFCALNGGSGSALYGAALQFLNTFADSNQRLYAGACMAALVPACQADFGNALNDSSGVAANNSALKIGLWILGGVLVAAAITTTVMVVRKRRKKS